VSGKNQHSIPRCFQRGFKPTHSGKDGPVWEYRRGIAPELKSIAEIAAGDYFYSEPPTDGQPSLDDRITKYENRFAKQLNKLRLQPLGPVADPTIPAKVVSHLVVRNQEVRGAFRDLAKGIILNMFGLFTNEQDVRDLLGLDGAEPSSQLRETIAEGIRASPLAAQTTLPLPVLERVLVVFVRERFAEFFDRQQPEIKGALAYFHGQADAIVHKAHNNALLKSFLPKEHINRLAQLRWSIREVPLAVMPDCVAIGIETNGEAHPLMFSDTDALGLVIMPLTFTRLLVGETDLQPAFDYTLINLHAAACSEEFFIAEQDNAVLKIWSGIIGAASRKAVHRAITEAYDEFRGARGLRPAIPSKVPHEAPAPAEFEPLMTCPMHFHGWADEQTARTSADAAMGVVYAASKHISLNRLDGITFAEDYPAALQGLDRGFATSKPLTSTQKPNAIGVAMSPIVIRDGVVKAHVVMRGFFARDLIGEDEDARNFAMYSLVCQLAQIAATELFDTAFPNVIGRPQSDAFEGYRYTSIDGAWESYYSASISAALYPKAGEIYRDIVLGALAEVQQQLPELRYAYRHHGDVLKFLGQISEPVGTFLRLTAKLLGHHDALETPPLDEPLTAALEKAQLTPWFNMYAGDLRALWDRRGKWTSLAEFLMLGMHFERLLWPFGIFLWRTPEGLCRVEVPLATDTQRLVREAVRQIS
jgi:hypothetical protein